MFVVDSADKERLNTAQEELWGLLEDKSTQNAPLLLCANKQVSR